MCGERKRAIGLMRLLVAFIDGRCSAILRGLCSSRTAIVACVFSWTSTATTTTTTITITLHKITYSISSIASSASNMSTILAFDLYGTLLSTASIASHLEKHTGDAQSAAAVASLWRTLQLEYTWRLTCMGQYTPFSTLTCRALSDALAQSGHAPLSSPQTDDLMKAYDALDTFPDVAPALDRIAAAKDVQAVVFSNGTHDMVANSVNGSQGLVRQKQLFKDLVVVEQARVFKPHAGAYRLLAGRMGVDEKEMGRLCLVSGNPFDIVGARAAGMRAVWVDRAGKGWTDGLVEGEKGRPSAIIKSLEELLDVAK